MTGIEELTEEIDLKCLKVGELYNGELIIDRYPEVLISLITLERIAPEAGHKRIDVNKYLVRVKSGKVESIILSDYQEYFPEDEDYEELNQKLKPAGL